MKILRALTRVALCTLQSPLGPVMPNPYEQNPYGSPPMPRGPSLPSNPYATDENAWMSLPAMDGGTPLTAVERDALDCLTVLKRLPCPQDYHRGGAFFGRLDFGSSPEDDEDEDEDEDEDDAAWARAAAAPAIAERILDVSMAMKSLRVVSVAKQLEGGFPETRIEFPAGETT